MNCPTREEVAARTERELEKSHLRELTICRLRAPGLRSLGLDEQSIGPDAPMNRYSALEVLRAVAVMLLPFEEALTRRDDDGSQSTTMPSITINGKKIVCSGRNVVVQGGRVTVDGVEVASGLSGEVTIRWSDEQGRGLASLQSDGSVTCGDVHGDVSAGGSVDCANVGRSVNAGGSVRAHKVSGPTTAGSSIKIGG